MIDTCPSCGRSLPRERATAFYDNGDDKSPDVHLCACGAAMVLEGGRLRLLTEQEIAGLSERDRFAIAEGILLARALSQPRGIA